MMMLRAMSTALQALGSTTEEEDAQHEPFVRLCNLMMLTAKLKRKEFSERMRKGEIAEPDLEELNMAMMHAVSLVDGGQAEFVVGGELPLELLNEDREWKGHPGASAAQRKRIPRLLREVRERALKACEAQAVPMGASFRT